MTDTPTRVDPSTPAPDERYPVVASSGAWGPKRLGLGIVVLLVWLVVGGLGGSYQGKLGEVQKNDNSAYLPASAESTRASQVADTFSTSATIPGFVVWQRDGGLTVGRQGGDPGHPPRTSPPSPASRPTRSARSRSRTTARRRRCRCRSWPRPARRR